MKQAVDKSPEIYDAVMKALEDAGLEDERKASVIGRDVQAYYEEACRDYLHSTGKWSV